MIVLGAKEKEENKISIRMRNGDKKDNVSIEELLEELKENAKLSK